MIKELHGTRAVFLVGHGFDDWVRAVAESLPEVKMFPVDKGINLIDQDGEDPHYWLSITNAKIIARNIAEALGEINPKAGKEYETNLSLFLSKLEEADRGIKEMFANLSAKKLLTFHDGWRYFARDYGLEIIGTVEPANGGEPTPKQLIRLAEVISKYDIKVLFSEPAVSKTVAESVAGDFHLRIYELDPIGAPAGSASRQGYLELLMANAHTIHEALSYG